MRHMVKINSEAEIKYLFILSKRNILLILQQKRDCFKIWKKIKNNVLKIFKGITVDDKRIADINALADKLISQGRTDTNAVKEKRNNLNQK